MDTEPNDGPNCERPRPSPHRNCCRRCSCCGQSAVGSFLEFVLWRAEEVQPGFGISFFGGKLALNARRNQSTVVSMAYQDIAHETPARATQTAKQLAKIAAPG